MESGYWYLGTPYTKYPGGLETAWKMACSVAGEFVRLGVPVYSPIAHTHPIAIHGDLDPLDHTIWLPFDMPMMLGAKGLIVVTAETWEESKGLAHEIQHFRQEHKQIHYTSIAGAEALAVSIKEWGQAPKPLPAEALDLPLR